MKTNLIFISGIPACGKTTIARELALKIKADKIIDLDCLKNTCKIFVSSQEDSYLYTTSHEAYKIENTKLIEGFEKYCESIQNYLINLINIMKNEKTIIIEGTQLTPGILSRLDKEKYNSILFSLIVDRKNFETRVYEKLKNRQGKWLEHIDEIFEIQSYLRKKNAQDQICILNNDKEKTIEKMIEVLENENIYKK